MFVLHIELKPKPGMKQALEKTYLESFRPAISGQEGFKEVQLLHHNDNDEDYRLTIAFDRRAQQQKWVATDLHQEVWPAVADQCSEFSVQAFNAV